MVVEGGTKNHSHFSNGAVTIVVSASYVKENTRINENYFDIIMKNCGIFDPQVLPKARLKAALIFSKSFWFYN